MKIEDPPIVLEFPLNCTISQAWSAITDPEEMVKWYFDNLPDFKPEVGFKTAFAVESKSRRFTHNWEITKVIPGSLIAYIWTYDEYPGRSDLTLELKENKGKTILICTVNVLKDFPDDIPEFKRQSCIDGWNYFLGGNLQKYLADL